MLHARTPFDPHFPSGVELPMADRSNMTFIHVSKAAGQSVLVELERERRLRPCAQYRMPLPLLPSMSELAARAFCRGNCECCLDAAPPTAFRGITVRSPRSHRTSMYLHCKLFVYNTVLSGPQAQYGHAPFANLSTTSALTKWVASTVATSANWITGMPGGQTERELFSGEWHADFERWLRHFGPAWTPRDGAFQCYHPRDFTTRAMTCGLPEATLHTPLTATYRPDLHLALSKMRRVQWVGAVELYKESWCLRQFQMTSRLPERCRCDRHAPAGVETHSSHGWTPPHSDSDLPARILPLIDALSALDSRLYAHAIVLLVRRLRRAEELTRAPILGCVDWDRLRNATGYVPGLWQLDGQLNLDLELGTDD